MPCESRIDTVIEWSKDTDATSLHAALAALKLNPNRSGQIIYFNGGEYHCSLNKLTLQGQRAEERTKELKRMYMSCATQAQARKYGFTVKQGKSAYDFELVKRRI